MPGTFTSELRPSMCFTIWPMLQVANFSKDFPSQNRETKTERTATATELEWRAMLARRSGLPTFSPRTLGAWGSSQNRPQASKPKELTSKLQASRPNSTDCPISTPRAVLNSKVKSQKLSLGCQSNEDFSVEKKESFEFDVDQKRPGATWSKGPAKSTLSANSRQRQFSPTSTFQSPSTEPRLVPPKRQHGGARSTEARYVLGTRCIDAHISWNWVFLKQNRLNIQNVVINFAKLIKHCVWCCLLGKDLLPKNFQEENQSNFELHSSVLSCPMLPSIIPSVCAKDRSCE